MYHFEPQVLTSSRVFKKAAAKSLIICHTVGLGKEDAELLNLRTLGKLSSYIDLLPRLGWPTSGRDRLRPNGIGCIRSYIHSEVGARMARPELGIPKWVSAV
jgi:hypothetical protein